MSVHTQYALTPSRSCPSFSNLQLSSPTILEPLPPTEPTERQIEREVEEHRRLPCFLTYGEAPLPQDIKNYKSPTCSQRPEPRRKEKGVYLPFKQVPGWGSEVAVTTVLGMIEVDRQVREGRGAYPKGWRSRELGLYDNKTIEFSIALSTDKNLNIFGCPDADADLVPDAVDLCDAPPYPNQGLESDGVKMSGNAVVDKTGCSLDSDNDGVFGGYDQCDGTFHSPVNSEHDPNAIVYTEENAGGDASLLGCAKDTDNDGIVDGIDQVRTVAMLSYL